MFWALILEPFKRYTQTVKQTFRITMASLDTSLAAKNEAIQIMVHNNKKNFLLCTLIKGKINQVALDLRFEKGSEITLFSNGQGYIHLTGYVELESSDEIANNEWKKEDRKKINEQAQKKLEDNKKDPKSNGAPQKTEKAKLSKTKPESVELSSITQAESSEDDNIEEDESDESESKYYYYDEDEDDDDDDKDTEEEEEEYGEDDDDDDDDEDDEDEEEEEEEEEEEKQKEKQDQKREQNKLAKSQKQEKKPENQQQKKKHDKQNKINGEIIKQQEQQNMKRKRKLENQAQQNNPSEAKKRIVEGGVQVEDIKIGNGRAIASGDIISIYYIGRCKIGKEDKKVDACTKGKGYKFRLGRGQVLKGWDVGLVGMKLGGKRRLTIPSEMGYGSRGFPPTIPPFSTLTFEIELKGIHLK